MDLISLLIAIIVICIFLWCVRMVIKAFNVPDPMATVLFVLAVLVCLLVMLQWFGGFSGLNVRIR